MCVKQNTMKIKAVNLLLLLSTFCEGLPTVKVSNSSLPSAMVRDLKNRLKNLKSQHPSLHKRLSATRNGFKDHRAAYTVGPIGFPTAPFCINCITCPDLLCLVMPCYALPVHPNETSASFHNATSFVNI